MTITTPVPTARKEHLDDLFATHTWTTALFADFWAEPDLSYVPRIITDDVIGIWPGGQVVRGRADYLAALTGLLTALPDLRLEVQEEAMNGEFGFSRWVMHATGKHGPFEMTGMDRTRIRDGLVCENYIFFDNTEFQALAGLPGA